MEKQKFADKIRQQVAKTVSHPMAKNIANVVSKKLRQNVKLKNRIPPMRVAQSMDMVRGVIGKVHQKMVPAPVALFEIITNMWMAQALSVAAELGIADLMGNKVMAAVDIAKRLGCNEDSVYRLMRALTTVDVFKEVSKGQFRLTSLGQCLRDDNPYSVKAMAAFQGQYHWAHWGNLMHSVKTGDSAVEHLRGKCLDRIGVVVA